MTNSPIVIWGSGAIGGSVGAFMARAGEDVLFVDRVAEHVAAMNETGLRISGPVAEFTTPVRAVMETSARMDRWPAPRWKATAAWSSASGWQRGMMSDVRLAA